LACGLRAFQGLAAPASAGIGYKIAALVSATLGPGGGWIACAFIIGAALMLTGSRGGIASSLVGTSVFIAFAAIRSRNRPIAVSATLLLTILGMSGVLLGFGDFLAERLEAESIKSDDRLAVYALTWRVILDAPWLGTGYGTFQDVFKMYRDASVPPPWFWDRAHDTYLELIQGLGVPVAVSFTLGGAVLIRHCGYAAIRRHEGTLVPLTALAVALIVCLHALVDFDLQVQAVALTWVALLGAGVAQSCTKRVDPCSKSSPSRPAREAADLYVGYN
jgi:O-antigen ligase